MIMLPLLKGVQYELECMQAAEKAAKRRCERVQKELDQSVKCRTEAEHSVKSLQEQLELACTQVQTWKDMRA